MHSRFERLVSNDSFPGDITHSTASPPPSIPYLHPTSSFHYDFTFRLQDGRVFVSLRPYLREFLNEISKTYEPILFTSALPIYANPVLNYIEQHLITSAESSSPPLCFRFRRFREHTVAWRHLEYVKDIRILGRPMNRAVLIDNSYPACMATPDNAIVVDDWEGGTPTRAQTDSSNNELHGTHAAAGQNDESKHQVASVGASKMSRRVRTDKRQDRVLLDVLEFLKMLDTESGGANGDVRPLLREWLGFRRMFPSV